MDSNEVVDVILSFLQNPYFLFSLGFWIFAFILVKLMGKKADNVTFFFPFLVLFRTRIFNKFFRYCASKGRYLWRIIWNIGIVVSFVIMILAMYFIVTNLIDLIVDPSLENAIIPLIPGVTIDLFQFTYLILPILFAMTIHEFSHAIAAEIDGVNIKSSGILSAGVFFLVGFGAFVELDEFQLDSRKVASPTRFRIAAAGTWSNIILAAIVLLIMNIYPSITRIGYQAEVFQITDVVTSAEGGYNEKRIFPGDIIVAINGTNVDLNANADLSNFLANETDIKVKAGDTLQFRCWNNTSEDYYNREILLGDRVFVGFTFEQYNNSAFQITEVFTTLQGGNNEGKIKADMIITQFDNQIIDYSKNITFERFLSEQKPPFRTNLTTNKSEIIQIRVDYYPKAPGAYYFDGFFMGIAYQNESFNSFILKEVFTNSSEYGINEGRVPENVNITKINGVSLNLLNITLREFVNQHFLITPGDQLIFTDIDGNDYTLNTAEIPIIPVYIGIKDESYWIPANFIGTLFGPDIPTFIRIELYYSWLLGFSLALFNLLPVSAFDGGRLMKDLIHKIVGYEYKPHCRKKLHYQYNSKDSNQQLMTHNVNKILSAKLIIDGNNVREDEERYNTQEGYFVRELKYKELDVSNCGFMDTIEIIDENKPAEKSIIEVEIDYDEDLKFPKKKRIYRSITYVILAILLANIIISVTKFGKTLFWL